MWINYNCLHLLNKVLKTLIFESKFIKTHTNNSSRPMIMISQKKWAHLWGSFDQITSITHSQSKTWDRKKRKKKKTCRCWFTKKALGITLYNSLGALLRWVGETHPKCQAIQKKRAQDNLVQSSYVKRLNSKLTKT